MTTATPTYSRRNRPQAAPAGVYSYDVVPANTRVQVNQILHEALGEFFSTEGSPNPCYTHVVKRLRRELGLNMLSGAPGPGAELFRWLENVRDVDRWLDGVELTLRSFDLIARASTEHRNLYRSAESLDEYIDELNARLQEAAVGYQFASGEMMRVDSMFVHKEMVVPALRLLHDSRFASAEQEYLDAHDAYRKGELEDCIVGCGRALESTLKVIGAGRSWPITENDPASKLIRAAVDANFFPSYLQSSLTHLRGLLESSTPTIRNKSGGHGAGTTPRVVPKNLAALQLHQTAAAILFLVEEDSALPQPASESGPPGSLRSV